MPRDAFVLTIQRELCDPKFARKVSGLSRNGSQDSPCLQITYWATVFQWVRSTRVPLLSTYRNANTRASGFAFGSGRSLWSLCYCPWFALITRGSCWPSSPRWSRGTGIALDKRCCTWDPGFTLISLLATEILSLS